MSGVEEQSRCPLGWRDARCGRFGPCGCEPPISPTTGPAVPSDEELRTAVTLALSERLTPRSGMAERAVARLADAVLALPEVAALLDAGEKVRRVEALVRFYDRHEYSSLVVDDLRRALDGQS